MVEPESELERRLSSWLHINRARVAALTVDAQASRAPWAVERHREALLRSTEYSLDCLGAAVLTRSPALFIDDLAWSKVMLASRGLPEPELARSLDALREVLTGLLDGALRDLVLAQLDEATRALPALPSALPGPAYEASPSAELCGRYLDALLAADHRGASAMILDAARSGVPVSELYLQVLAPVQHEIGRLWQTNRISVAQEHYCTAVTQQVMARLQPQVFGAARVGRRIVVTAVSGELHELGARMVADFFELAGWDGYYLGASTPLSDLLLTLVEQRAELLAISATTTPNVTAVIDVVRAIRACPQTATLPILVGGHAFNLVPDLWRIVGASGTTSSPVDAVQLGRVLVGERAGP